MERRNFMDRPAGLRPLRDKARTRSRPGRGAAIARYLAGRLRVLAVAVVARGIWPNGPKSGTSILDGHGHRTSFAEPLDQEGELPDLCAIQDSSPVVAMSAVGKGRSGTLAHWLRCYRYLDEVRLLQAETSTMWQALDRLADRVPWICDLSLPEGTPARDIPCL
ncbi:hypothetical protein GGTG_02566 [Gaeumannomyces tritici R3-111a-1]|uniref:Uncharacterized protein n=1 Tax=Gaeumannomyces tritici (strain R3-111a-1) TaxID=644352 RepID=J3NMR0_GAET3|nr:hypothetical protein GGTG_02566 [Gaeumannomyces tritici R3-111a-1]EJT82593.1 hypothetical protein GGTG_02566 [Gaeumannomyces tritici R3-111a-1]